MAWAALRLGDADAAAKLFRKVADRARLALGGLRQGDPRQARTREKGEVDEAVACWAGLDPKWRGAFGLDEPLRQSVLPVGPRRAGRGPLRGRPPTASRRRASSACASAAWAG